MKKTTLFAFTLFFTMSIGSFSLNAQSRGRMAGNNSRPVVNGDNRSASNVQIHDNRNIGTVSWNDAQLKKEKTKVVAIRQFPSRAERVVYNNNAYEYNNGRFYMQHGGRYIQVAPKAGLRIKTLPPQYAQVRFGNVSYFFFDGTFYSGYNGYYEVVNPAIGTIVSALPSDYEKVMYRGDMYYEYNGILYDKVRTAYGNGYQVVGYLS